MIRVNLIDVSQERRKLEFISLAVVAGVVWVVTLLGLFLWHQGLASEIRRVKDLIAKESSELEQLRKTVGEVEKIKQEKAQLENKLNIITGLEKNRYHSLRLLQELSELITDEIWLEGLEFQGNQVKLKGLAVDMQSVGNFLKKLRDQPRFSQATVSNVKSVGGGGGLGVEVVSFELQASYAPSGTQPASSSPAPKPPGVP